MVIVAVLEVVPVFSWNVAVIIPLPVPEGVTVHQAWLLVAAQDMLDKTSKLTAPEEDKTFWFDGVTVNVGVVPV